MECGDSFAAFLRRVTNTRSLAGISLDPRDGFRPLCCASLKFFRDPPEGRSGFLNFSASPAPSVVPRAAKNGEGIAALHNVRALPGVIFRDPWRGLIRRKTHLRLLGKGFAAFYLS